jgi:hypothetical protein|tara:strand:- start:1673 stop:1903 length:231 start_codon:yes stop_codon:yes gene_type:complete
MKGYIVVRQYVKQEHQCPKMYITELVMDNNVFEEGFGVYRHKVFTKESDVLEVVDEFNKTNPYRKWNYIEVEIDHD